MKSKVFVSASNWLEEVLEDWISKEKPSNIISMTQSSQGGNVVLTIIYN